MRQRRTPKLLACVGAVLVAGATLRIQHVSIVGESLTPQNRWRVLLPGQDSHVTQSNNTKLMTDDYVAFGLVRFGGEVSWKETLINVD